MPSRGELSTSCRWRPMPGFPRRSRARFTSRASGRRRLQAAGAHDAASGDMAAAGPCRIESSVALTIARRCFACLRCGGAKVGAVGTAAIVLATCRSNRRRRPLRRGAAGRARTSLRRFPWRRRTEVACPTRRTVRTACRRESRDGLFHLRVSFSRDQPPIAIAPESPMFPPRRRSEAGDRPADLDEADPAYVRRNAVLRHAAALPRLIEHLEHASRTCPLLRSRRQRPILPSRVIALLSCAVEGFARRFDGIFRSAGAAGCEARAPSFR